MRGACSACEPICPPNCCEIALRGKLTKITQDNVRAPYQSPLRAKLKKRTSEIILEAVGSVARDYGLAAVSIAEVARVGEITDRTVYRHFATRDELISAFIRWHLEQAVGGPDIELPNTIDELLAWLEWRYRAWEHDFRIVSEAYLSPLGRELRAPLFALGRANILKMLTIEYPHMAEDTRQIIASTMISLMSTENFVFLQYNLGYGAEQTHRTVVAGIRAVIMGSL